MKIALTTWNGRIAPVFDAARSVTLYAADADPAGPADVRGLPEADFAAKVAYLKQEQVTVVVCGGISRTAWQYAIEQGLTVHPFVAGQIADVFEAWKKGNLPQARYAMPGCQRRRRNRGTRVCARDEGGLR